VNNYFLKTFSLKKFVSRYNENILAFKQLVEAVVIGVHTLINDSQVSHFSSRYWEEMYPEHRYTHYYLGVLGTHHWGIAFPFTIKDDAKIGGNAFPRATLLKSVASFIASLDRQ
jgi:hypothetical protein